MPPQPPPSRRAPASRHPRPSRLTRRDVLALRKEIVLTRIAIERAELIQATHVARERLRPLRWVPYLLLGDVATLSRFGTLARSLARYPRSPVASLALTGLSHTRVGRVVRSILQWGGLGMLVWRGLQRRPDTTQRSVAPAGGAATPKASMPSSPPAPAAGYYGALPLM